MQCITLRLTLTAPLHHATHHRHDGCYEHGHLAASHASLLRLTLTHHYTTQPLTGMTEATRTAISRLAKASSLEGLPAKAGEPLNVCAYSDAKQRLYFFGQDVQQRVETLHYLTLSDLEQGVGAVRIGGAAGEDPQDRFYGGTRVTNLSFNSTGDRLLLSGPPSESIPYLGVVDLRNDDDSAPPTSSSSSSKKVAVRAPHRQLLPLEMRGRLLKAAWHPSWSSPWTAMWLRFASGPSRCGSDSQSIC